MKKRLMSIVLVLVYVLALLPAGVLAAGPYQLAIADCAVIGDWDDYADILLYPQQIPASYSEVEFTDLEITDDFSMIASTGAFYVAGTNIAPISQSYAYEEDEDFNFISAYADYDFSEYLLFWITDDDGEMYFVLASVEDGNPFTPSVGAVTGCAADGYTVPFVGGTVDLYTVAVPYGTQGLTLEFDAEYIAYAYTADGGYIGACDASGAGYASNGQVGETAAAVRLTESGALPAYVVVQTPYDPNWSSDALFAVRFDESYAFTASVGGETLTDITVTADGYTGSTMGPAVTVHVFTVTVPAGTESVDLSFDGNVLAYNYTADGTYLGGWLPDGDYMVGATAVTVQVDLNNDSAADYIQVQTPYDASYNSTILYAITFADAGGAGGGGSGQLTDDLLTNIAAGYTDSADEWVVMDMAAYAALRPAAAEKTTAAARQTYIENAIAAVQDASATDTACAKAVIILTALGADARELYPAGSVEPIDAVEKLNAATQSASVWNAPYTLAAYNQGDYANTETYENALVDALLNAQQADGSWNEYGMAVDSTANAILGLAFYVDRPAVRTAIDAGVTFLAGQMADDGTFDGGWGANANTTAMAVCALAAAGVDPAADSRFVKANVSALDGLLSFAMADKSGFTYAGGASLDAYATEQGFRALIAAARVAADAAAYNVYDFSGNAVEPVHADAENATISFTLVPADAAVEVTGADSAALPQAAAGVYRLPAGTYGYTVTRSGYDAKTGSFTVAAAGETQTVSVSLNRTEPSGGGSVQTVQITVYVLAHDADTCGNSLTYKNNADKYASLLADDKYVVTLEKGVGTARDALVKALDANSLSYREISDGYFAAIGGYTEQSHGANSGWMYLVNGVAATSAAKNVTFSRNAAMVWYFTDDYTKDYGSEEWSSGGSGGRTPAAPTTPVVPVTPAAPAASAGSYTDVEGHWGADAIAFVTEKGLMNGLGENAFGPDETTSRAMVITILARLDGQDTTGGENWYAQAAAWANANGISDGSGLTDDVTREQICTMIHRYLVFKGVDVSAAGNVADFPDGDKVSPWAIDAMKWALGAGLLQGRTDGTLDPGGSATRAELATILQRLDTLLNS